MKKMTKRLGAVMVLLGGVATTPVGAVELINNGDFETGMLAGWTVFNTGYVGGSWFADTPGTTTPVQDLPTAANSMGGTTYVVTDQNGYGVHALLQSFTVPISATAIYLSFDMFVNDWDSGPIVNSAGLTTSEGPNQHGRVDILTNSASVLSTAVADIVANLYLGVDGGTDPNPYTAYLFDLTGVLSPGSTYQLRFAEVDTQYFLNMGVDNISLQAVPEPVTLALFGLGLAGLAAAQRRRFTT